MNFKAVFATQMKCSKTNIHVKMLLGCSEKNNQMLNGNNRRLSCAHRKMHSRPIESESDNFVIRGAYAAFWGIN